MQFHLNNWEWKLDLPFSDLGNYFARTIRKRSITTLVVGKQGSGKSVSMASLCMQIDKNFSELNMCWDMDSFYEKVDKLVEANRPYSVMIADDFGSEADAYDFINQSQKNLNHLLEKYRTFHIGLFITVPHPRFISKNIRDRISDYQITILGHNEYTGFAKAQVKMKRIRFDKDSPDMTHLYTYLDGSVFSNTDPGRIKILTWDIPKPPKTFFDWYLPFRQELGKAQFKKSKAEHDHTQSQKKKGTKEQIELDAKMLMDQGDKYIKTWRGEQVLNVDLARANYGFKDKYSRILNAYIKEKYLK
jgi:hypothetical protein